MTRRKKPGVSRADVLTKLLDESLSFVLAAVAAGSLGCEFNTPEDRASFEESAQLEHKLARASLANGELRKVRLYLQASAARMIDTIDATDNAIVQRLAENIAASAAQPAAIAAPQ